MKENMVDLLQGFIKEPWVSKSIRLWQTGIIKAPQRDFCRILDGAVEETAGDRETLAAAIGAYQGLDTLAVSPVCAVGGSISWTGSPQSRYHLLRCDHATNGLID